MGKRTKRKRPSANMSRIESLKKQQMTSSTPSTPRSTKYPVASSSAKKMDRKSPGNKMKRAAPVQVHSGRWASAAEEGGADSAIFVMYNAIGSRLSSEAVHKLLANKPKRKRSGKKGRKSTASLAQALSANMASATSTAPPATPKRMSGRKKRKSAVPTKAASPSLSTTKAAKPVMASTASTPNPQRKKLTVSQTPTMASLQQRARRDVAIPKLSLNVNRCRRRWICRRLNCRRRRG